jgi:GT2 family glycosyltransferase
MSPSVSRAEKPPVGTEAPGHGCKLSVIVVSFNTRDVLRRCLTALETDREQGGLEILVIDNGSRDGSADMVAHDFPHVQLVRAATNLGFAGANNVLFARARGQYLVLLNSDAFLRPGALKAAVDRMDAEPATGLAGARLISDEGDWQPSARQFPSVLNDFLSLSGLANRFKTSRFWGRADRTWADPLQAADVDWVPGAFSIIRASALRKIGAFDSSFFLYYEEVDLCRRIKAAGYKVRYWPEVVVVHVGGESSKSMENAVRSSSGDQLTLWRLRSAFLYYRKHHGSVVARAMAMEYAWHLMRLVRNRVSGNAARRLKAAESYIMLKLVRQAWQDTQGGRVSPPRPW